MSEVYDKKINTWPFPYHPGYQSSFDPYQYLTASRADTLADMEKVMY